MTPEQEQEYREEAERLARLPAEERQAYLAWQRDLARTAPRKADRQAAARRAEALDTLLRRSRKKRRS